MDEVYLATKSFFVVLNPERNRKKTHQKLFHTWSDILNNTAQVTSFLAILHNIFLTAFPFMFKLLAFSSSIIIHALITEVACLFTVYLAICLPVVTIYFILAIVTELCFSFRIFTLLSELFNTTFVHLS